MICIIAVGVAVVVEAMTPAPPPGSPLDLEPTTTKTSCEHMKFGQILFVVSNIEGFEPSAVR